jgi:hypothetical protein
MVGFGVVNAIVEDKAKRVLSVAPNLRSLRLLPAGRGVPPNTYAVENYSRLVSIDLLLVLPIKSDNVEFVIRFIIAPKTTTLFIGRSVLHLSGSSHSLVLPSFQELFLGN